VYQCEPLSAGSNRYLNGREWVDQEAALRRIAAEAAGSFGLGPKDKYCATHMGNFGFSDYGLAVVLEEAEPSYLLTVHFPYDDFSLIEMRRQLASMCEWMLALDRDTSIDIQTPVANGDGEFCPLFDHRPTGPAAVVTLRRWVPGKPIAESDSQADLTEEVSRRAGRVLGELHSHSSSWIPSRQFSRFHADWACDLEELAQGDNWELLSRAMSAVAEYREAAAEPWGITHGDFQASNLLADGDRLLPIDFDVCVMAHHYNDLGWFLQDLVPGSHHAFVDGYRRVVAVPGDFERLMDGAYIAASIRRCAWGGDWRDPGTVVEACERYLAGRSFLFG